MKNNDGLIKRHLFNFPGYAKELHSYIFYNYMRKTHAEWDEKILIKAMEELILDLVKVTIYDSANKIIPNYAIDEETAYEIYGHKVNVDPIKMSMLMVDSLLMDRLLQDVYDLVRDKPWHLFTVRRGMIEDMGDWRILQWEREHLDEKGNYVDKKDNSESTTSI